MQFNSSRPRQLRHARTINALLLGLFSSCIFSMQSAIAEVQITVTGGEDRWSQRVNQEFAPRSKKALQALELLAKNDYGVELGARLPLVIAATLKASLPDNAEKNKVVYLEAGLSEIEIRERSLKQPLRQGVHLLIDELTKGNKKNLPDWFAFALADNIAANIIEGLQLSPLPSYANELPVVRPINLSEKKAAQKIAEQRRAILGEKVRLGIFQILQQQNGSNFHTRVRAYLQAFAEKDSNPEQVFNMQFGISQNAVF
ncbi:hypothetical protein [Undibacterium sp. RuTC16W]|uniref:hypothetical protein n=1 Tax=Undibacterium sp. RuTC16W TaxID=3413048 RepID=UPI003BF0DB0B